MLQKTVVKGILHPKNVILSSFTHPQVVANLYEFLSSAENTKEDIFKNDFFCLYSLSSNCFIIPLPMTSLKPCRLLYNVINRQLPICALFLKILYSDLTPFLYVMLTFPNPTYILYLHLFFNSCRPGFLPDPNDGSLYVLGGKHKEGLMVSVTGRAVNVCLRQLQLMSFI